MTANISGIIEFRNMLASTLPITSTGKNGFHIHLSNGYKVSVQWEAGTCSDNHDLVMRKGFEEWGKSFLRSNTAEVAVFNPGGELIETPVLRWRYCYRLAMSFRNNENCRMGKTNSSC